MAIPPEELDRLEEKVRRLMAQGRWQEGLEEIRAAAVLYQESRDGLVKKVIAKAFEQGHVRPLIEMETSD